MLLIRFLCFSAKTKQHSSHQAEPSAACDMRNTCDRQNQPERIRESLLLECKGFCRLRRDVLSRIYNTFRRSADFEYLVFYSFRRELSKIALPAVVADEINSS